MSTDLILYGMLACHLASAVISLVAIGAYKKDLATVERARDKNAATIRRLEGALLGAQNKEFLLKTELTAAKKNDGRDPVTGRFTGAKE